MFTHTVKSSEQTHAEVRVNFFDGTNALVWYCEDAEDMQEFLAYVAAAWDGEIASWELTGNTDEFDSMPAA
jgi:hypothetical protein